MKTRKYQYLIFITTETNEDIVASFFSYGDAAICVKALNLSVSTPGYSYTIKPFKTK
jgi:hypothetical protein